MGAGEKCWLGGGASFGEQQGLGTSPDSGGARFQLGCNHVMHLEGLSSVTLKRRHLTWKSPEAEIKANRCWKNVSAY